MEKRHWFVYDPDGNFVCAFIEEAYARQYIRHKDGYYYDYSEEGI